MKNNLAVIKRILNGLYLKEQLSEIYADAAYLDELIENPEYIKVMDPLSNSIKAQTQFISKILDNLKCEKLRQHLSTQLKHGAIDEFQPREFQSFFKSLLLEIAPYKTVKLQVALDFKPADLRDMAQQLEEQLEQPVVLDLTVDPKLIGGAVVQYGTRLIDHSIKSRMNQFEENWQAAVKE